MRQAASGFTFSVVFVPSPSWQNIAFIPFRETGTDTTRWLLLLDRPPLSHGQSGRDRNGKSGAQPCYVVLLFCCESPVGKKLGLRRQAQDSNEQLCSDCILTGNSGVDGGNGGGGGGRGEQLDVQCGAVRSKRARVRFRWFRELRNQVECYVMLLQQEPSLAVLLMIMSNVKGGTLPATPKSHRTPRI